MEKNKDKLVRDCRHLRKNRAVMNLKILHITEKWWPWPRFADSQQHKTTQVCTYFHLMGVPSTLIKRSMMIYSMGNLINNKCPEKVLFSPAVPESHFSYRETIQLKKIDKGNVTMTSVWLRETLSLQS